MSASVFFTDPGSTPDVGELVVLSGPEAHHAIAVVRVRVGEVIELVDGDGIRVRGTVECIEPKHLHVRAQQVIIEPAPALAFTVIQAIPKSDHGELAVDLMTQAGVDTVVPYAASRSVSIWRADKAEKSRAKWQQAAAAASKQSRRARIPRVHAVASLVQVCELIADADCAVVLHEQARIAVADHAPARTGSMVIVVGPEGGMDDAVVAQMCSAGATAISLGPRIVRSSAAGAFAVTYLSAQAAAISAMG